MPLDALWKNVVVCIAMPDASPFKNVNPKDVIEDLHRSAAKRGILLDKRQLEQFAVYCQELFLWNRQMNLVSERSVQEIVSRHFLDSLTPLPLLRKDTASLMDLGSGGGFPGIPISIMMPHMRVFLVDASRKKTSFLLRVIGILHLPHITVVRERIERLMMAGEWAGTLDAVISRAAFPLEKLILFSSFFLKSGGQLIAMKGNLPPQESVKADAAAADAGMHFQAEKDFSDFFSLRKIIIYQRL